MRYRVGFGGRGSAKSWQYARALLVYGSMRRLRILCARELQASIKDSVHRLLVDQIEMLGIRGYTTTRDEIRHARTRTRFIFKGVRNNAEGIKSTEGVDLCWIEEAHRVSEDSWEIVIPTIRKDGSEIWVTFNPDQESDPCYKRFVVNPPPNSIVREVNWRDNPWFTKPMREEKDYLYRVDPDAAAHVWGGATRQATNAQIMHGKWVVDAFEPGEDWDGPYQGTDFGFSQDPSTLIRIWLHGRKLFVEHEAYKVGLELDDTAEFFKGEVPDAEIYTTRADNAEAASISYLRRHGLPRITPCTKGPGSVEDGIRYLRQLEQIVIHPRCVHTEIEARLYSYKVDKRTGDILPEIVDRHNHCWDAIRYALGKLIKRGPRPRIWFPGMKDTPLKAKQPAINGKKRRPPVFFPGMKSSTGSKNGHGPTGQEAG